jgi:uncharacterized membrane protein YgdD (TMEM256/DUF423 family)
VAETSPSSGLSTQGKVLLSIAGIALLEATIGGALASHVLSSLDERALRSFSTAVEFEFFHGLGLVGLVALGFRGRAGQLRAVAAWLAVAGIVLFCGSLYFTAVGAPRGLTAAAPFGGVAFMLAWVLLAVSPWVPEPAAPGR